MILNDWVADRRFDPPLPLLPCFRACLPTCLLVIDMFDAAASPNLSPKWFFHGTEMVFNFFPHFEEDHIARAIPTLLDPLRSSRDAHAPFVASLLLVVRPGAPFVASCSY